MAYIGSSPVFTTFTSAAEQFSGNDSDVDFTLSRLVYNPIDLEVLVENVQQDPFSAYTVNGTTLTFTEAPPTGSNNITVTYRNYIVQRILPDDDSITSAMLRANAVTTIAIANGSITSDKIADGTVIAADIAANSVTSSEIADGAVQANNIQDNAVTADKLADTTVTPGVYGGSTAIPVVTVDQQGRLTNVANTAIVVGDAYPHPFVFTSIGT